MIVAVRLARRIVAVIVLGAGASSCGYQGSYRYECQDPENWEAEECNPPMCQIENVCWKDLVGIGEGS